MQEKVKVVKGLRGKYKFSLLLEVAGLSKQSNYYVIKHIDDKDNKDKFYERFHYKNL